MGETEKTDTGFTAAEKAAMKERAKELKAQKTREESTKAQLEKIAELPQPDRGLAERIHAIVTATAPSLAPKLWYGMPGYAKDGKILCFFQPASKFDARYATFGFNDVAMLDDGAAWPTSFAIVELIHAVEKQIAELVAKAAR
ncbi:MAG: DUF1801 domain-containing protein [Salinibacterium sp.]|nr:DUF1801 domain-containing protein [Salinibacterium sp.]